MQIHGIQLERNWDIDHLCFRADSIDSYEQLKIEFKRYGHLLIESEVNGRPISTFKLHQPIHFKEWTIDLIELPAPKPGKIITRGFEHIEIVCDLPFDELIERYSHLPMDKKGLTKDFNQELELSLGERNIKFHHLSLESVVNLENNLKVWSAIKNLKILNLLKDDSVVLFGDLLLNNPDSPVELYSSSSESKVRSLFGHLDRFDVKPNVCSFTFESVLFRIFFQEGRPLERPEFKNFQKKERQLKYQKN